MQREPLCHLVAAHKAGIEAICESHGAPLGTIFVDGSLNKAQRTKGNIGRVYLMLADEEPGWRVKDNQEARKRLKAAVRDMLAEHGLSLAVHVQANYSCLAMEGGMVMRRDRTGKVIGAYFA